MVKENKNIPNDFEFIIKHSKSDRFSSDVNLIEVFRMNISDYNSVKKEYYELPFNIILSSNTKHSPFQYLFFVLFK